ncbi:hypothetical protein QEG73_19925 [Chitinophagaceae bacterium 26-R-25]|nr:hypothetical protein [Chitinophagaceae bacterium 26-R-25]
MKKNLFTKCIALFVFVPLLLLCASQLKAQSVIDASGNFGNYGDGRFNFASGTIQLDIYGSFTNDNGPGGNFYVDGDVNVKSGAVLNNFSGNLYIYGDLTIDAGATQFFNNGNIYVYGNIVNNMTMALNGTGLGTGTLHLAGSASETLGTTSVQTVSGSQPFVTYNLEINNTSGKLAAGDVVLNQSIYVNNVATFTKGIVTTPGDTYPLVFNTAAKSPTTQATASHVVGVVRTFAPTGSFTFPIGDGKHYRKMDAAITANSAGLDAKYMGADAGNAAFTAGGTGSGLLQSYYNQEHWLANALAPASTSASFVLYYGQDADDAAYPAVAPAISNIANVRVAHKTAGGWWNEGSTATGTTTAGAVTSNTITGAQWAATGNWSPLTISTTSGTIVVSAKVLLQGAVSGTSMTTTLNTLGVIPTTQPYNKAPWNYAGTESVASIPAGVTDWVLVELHDKTTPATVIATRAAFVKSDGTVVDLDGTSPVSFQQAPDNYYVAIRHRNHLGIRTAATQALSSTATLYDFTSGQAQAYQNAGNTANTAMKDLGNGKFAMWGGDGTGNGKVSYNGVNNDESYLSSGALGGVLSTVLSPVYHNADYNMNGKVSYNGVANDESFLSSGVLGSVLTLIISQHL